MIKILFPNHGTNLGTHEETIRLISRQEQNPYLLEAYDETREILLINKAMDCIEDHLSNNRPIIIGVDEGNPSRVNDEYTTDHFLVIIGQGYDNNGFYYTYIETGTDYEEFALDFQNNKIYFDPIQYQFRGIAKNRKIRMIYTITHIRPNYETSKWSNYTTSVKDYKYL